jgi:Squalene-hopene cyclase C-terminal domain
MTDPNSPAPSNWPPAAHPAGNEADFFGDAFGPVKRPSAPAAPPPLPGQVARPPQQAWRDPRAAAAGAEQLVPSTRGVQLITPELEELFENAPPWLGSLVLHMTVLIILGLTVFVTQEKQSAEVQAVYGEKLGDQLLDSSVDLSTPTPDLTADKAVYSPSELPPVNDPIAMPRLGTSELPLLSSPLGMPTTGKGYKDSQSNIPIGLALSGREKGMKVVLLRMYGGNATTQDAVHRALEWLKKNQRSDGSWNLRGAFADPAPNDNPVAATAMALIAFQGDGNTHLNGEYKQVVKKAWDALLKMQNRDGQFVGSNILSSHQLYTHALATIAICELYGMTEDSMFRGPAERAIDFCVQTQSPQGGWRYSPGDRDADTSVSGWFSMALQSARMAKMKVPQGTLDNLSTFLDSVQIEEGSRYMYQPTGHTNPAMAAEGLLCREYLGWKRDDPRLMVGVQYILAHPIEIRAQELDPYYWYYATQVLHHFGGEPWKKWNEVMRQVVPETQVKKGPEAGSWDSQHYKYGSEGGRLYVTCLHTYMLEVYYRHLPLYSNVYMSPGQVESEN